MRKLAFTLIELLIVVIILGILAAVVIPQFSDASGDARVSSCQTNLATIRGQIELYKMQHNSTYPTFLNFTTQMTAKTNANGTTTGTPTLGPYMQAIPNNPFSSPPTNAVVSTAANAITSAWFYTEATGVFKADDGQSSNGTAHSTY